MLKIKNLESINLEVSQKEAKMLNGGAAGVINPALIPLGAKAGGFLGGLAGTYYGTRIATGQSTYADAQNAGIFFWTGAGGFLGAGLGGASLAE